MITLRPAEETWVDQGKDGETNIHLDGTRLLLLMYPVAAADYGRRFTQTRYCVLGNDVGVIKLRKT